MRCLATKIAVSDPFNTVIRNAEDSGALGQAVELLGQGQLVAVPTETVYGLAANALSSEAVARIFEAKGRPSNNPLIVHVDSVEMARDCVSAWPRGADRLAKAFWPGPISMVLPKAEKIPTVVTAGGDTVAVRRPAHPLMREVLTECGFPLAAPSANLSNRVSPTRAQHVAEQLSGRIPMILDGGACDVGIESTVIDLTGETPVILRMGMIRSEMVSEILGDVRMVTESTSGAILKSPGQLRRHYSPMAQVILAEEPWQDALGKANTDTHVIAYEPVAANWNAEKWHQLPATPEGYARELYETFHRCDEAGSEKILVQPLPEGLEWEAIRDRLSRAAN